MGDNMRTRTAHSLFFTAARGAAGMIFRVAAVILAVISTGRAQSAPGSDPNYVALRNLTLGSEAISVKNLELKRDAGTFRLNSGTVCFVPPVNGRVTGAVIVGVGNFLLVPPTESERKSLKYLTKEDEFRDRKSTRLNSSHQIISYAVFCLKKKKKKTRRP